MALPPRFRDSNRDGAGTNFASAHAAGPPANRRADWSTVVLLAPACVLFAVFVVYPIIGSINLSFHDWNGVGERTWVGLANYRELLTDPVFARALANNLRWLGGYLLAPLFGLALALVLNQALFGIGVIRTLFFMPFVLSQVVVGLVFAWFFHSRFGLFDNLLAAVGLPHVAPLESGRRSDLHGDLRRALAADRLLHDPLPHGARRVALTTSSTPRASTVPAAGRCSGTRFCRNSGPSASSSPSSVR